VPNLTTYFVFKRGSPNKTRNRVGCVLAARSMHCPSMCATMMRLTDKSCSLPNLTLTNLIDSFSTAYISFYVELIVVTVNFG